LTFAAVDAGSNAIRVIIAQGASPGAFKSLKKERYAVRLGHSVFTKGAFDKETIDEAANAFLEIARLFDEFGVDQYRAVATSAAREAGNRAELIRRIKAEADLDLEVIDGTEEARLVRTAVLAALGPKLSPRLIFDLGGGSLEVNLLDPSARGRDGAVETSFTLPIGTVRLMEGFDIQGPISPAQRYDIESRVLGLLHDHLPQRVDLAKAMAVACGGNAEALRDYAPSEIGGRDALDLRALYEELDEMTPLSVKDRMEIYGVRRDRAEVMAIAGIVFTTLGRMLGLEHLLIPGVGVRDGTLEDLAAGHFRTTGHARRK
jgi:exopolyphosphatase/guanosine-5'-triphosphate,3'-diphosphate pyrophosphatase